MMMSMVCWPTYDLSDEERAALKDGDIGKLYVLGVNGQILMHFAAHLGIEWFDYLERMRQGVAAYGAGAGRRLRDDWRRPVVYLGGTAVSLVYAGIASHGPGITGRAHLVDNTDARDALYEAFDQQRQAIEASGAEVLIVVAAEHFANFFMDNMPSFCIGMGEQHEGPIEDPDWLRIPHTKIPGAPALAERLVKRVMQNVDVAYAEEWKCDHGIMVPLHFLTPRYDLPVIPVNINCQGPPLAPLHRVWAFGEALREACDQESTKIALVGTGGISHWPATPDSGKINEAWDRAFLAQLMSQDREALLAYTDEAVYADAGQGGFEIRTLIAAAAAARGRGQLEFYTAELPIFAVGCTVASFALA